MPSVRTPGPRRCDSRVRRVSAFEQRSRARPSASSAREARRAGSGRTSGRRGRGRPTAALSNAGIHRDARGAPVSLADTTSTCANGSGSQPPSRIDADVAGVLLREEESPVGRERHVRWEREAGRVRVRTSLLHARSWQGRAPRTPRAVRLFVDAWSSVHGHLPNGAVRLRRVLRAERVRRGRRSGRRGARCRRTGGPDRRGDLERRPRDARVRHRARAPRSATRPRRATPRGRRARVASTRRDRLLRRTRRWNETMPPNADICRAATSCPGWRGESRIVTVRRRAGASPGTPRPRAALSQCAAHPHRRASSVRGARGSSPSARDRADRVREEPERARRSSVVARDDRAADQVGVPAEVLRHAVDDHVGAERRAAAAARASRTCCRRRPARRAACATAATAAMSTIFSIGFDGVSNHTSCVPVGERRRERVEVGRGRRWMTRQPPRPAARSASSRYVPP